MTISGEGIPSLTLPRLSSHFGLPYSIKPAVFFDDLASEHQKLNHQ